MQLHDLFEGNEQAYNWHSEPEQRNIDATRQARLYREREPEGSEAIDARIRARYDQLDQYNQSGKFWLKQKDTQEHISDAMIGKAAATAAAVELLKQRPELKGNLVITAYGPGESQGVAEGILGSDPNRGQKVPDWAKRGIAGKIGRKLDSAWSDAQMTVPQHLISKQSSAPALNTPTSKDTPKTTSATPTRATRAIPQSAGSKSSHPATKNVVKTIADKQGVAEGEKSPMAKDAQRADRIRSLKNLIAIAREQGRQLRVQELELELKKLQGVTEMDKSSPQPGRDGRVSHSTYGSRDKGGSKGTERAARPITAKKAAQHALDILKKQGVAEGLSGTQKKIEDTILKLEQRLKFAKTPEQWDNIKNRIERLQAGLDRSKQGVAEGAGNIGSAIKSLYQKIYAAGDDEIEYFYNASPIFAQYWDEYEGDLDSIIAEVDPSELQVIKAELESYAQDANLAEGNDDVWGPQGNFAGDKPVDVGGSVSKKLGVDDTVTYFGEKATILAMSKDRTVSRIHLKSGITQNVKTSDLKRVGQGMAEAPGAETLSHNQSTVASNLNSLDLDEGWKEKLGAAALAGSMALGAAGANAGALGTDTTWSPNKPVATQQATDTSYIGGKPQADYNTDTRILTYKGKQYKQDINAQATGKGEIVTAPSIAVGSRNMFPTKVELHPNGTYSRAVANEGDISQLEKDIADAPVAPIANMEADEKIGGRYDADDFDAMVSRLKKLAGAGPMKTVYDPNKRVYRNVPTAVQPAQQPKK